MEEFGDWIYILVIVIAAVSSIISSMRKKAQQAAELNKPREVIVNSGEKDDYWGDLSKKTETEPDDFWGELTGNTAKKPAVKSQPKPKQPVKKSYTPIGKPITSFLDSYLEGQTAITTNEIATIEAIEEHVAFSVKDLPDDTDEWRKAFIYNEIFARKN